MNSNKQGCTNSSGFIRQLTKMQGYELKRLLSDENCWLYKWFSDEKRTPFLGVRNGYASIYVKGCAFEFRTNRNGEAYLKFNAKYLQEAYLKEKLIGFIRNTHYEIPSETLQVGKTLNDIVDEALRYIDPEIPEGKRSHDKERPLATKALLSYPLSLDCEICFTANMVETVKHMPEARKYKSLPKKPDALLLQNLGDRLTLRFFEIKEATSSELKNKSVLNQVKLYDGILKNFEECITEQYKNVIQLYSELAHPRFLPFKSLVNNLDKMNLDLHHDIVILSVKDLTDKFAQLKEELEVEMNSLESTRKRCVHFSHTAAEWL